MSETKAPRPRNVLIAEFEGLSKEDASQALRDAGGDLEKARALVRRRRANPDDTDDDEPAVKAPRQRPNHPRSTNPSHVARSASQAQETKNRSEGGRKRMKTIKAKNEALEPGMAASLAPWDSAERRKLLDAVEAHNKRWKDVAAAVGSRTWVQCRQQYGFLKKVERLVPITETTPLRAKIFKGFHASAFKKCVAKHLGDKKITTVGQLAALDLDVSKPENAIYLKKLTGQNSPQNAVDMAAPWKAKAIEALAFWQ